MKPNWTVFLLIVAVWLLVYLVTERRKKSRPKSGGFTIPKSAMRNPPRNADIRHSKSTGQVGFQALVRACFGDTAKAQRLVEFELRRDRSLTWHQAVVAAVNRLADDRSR